jgi:hypothetical protein
VSRSLIVGQDFCQAGNPACKVMRDSCERSSGPTKDAGCEDSIGTGGVELPTSPVLIACNKRAAECLHIPPMGQLQLASDIRGSV